jgi:anti-sigma28 factor (negative regulator of flagellin synthesis)
MKVNETPVTVPAATPRVIAGSGQAEQLEQKPVVEDRVSITSPQQTAALDAVRSTVASGRVARVQEVINAVKSGQYYPSPQQIAQQLVSEAEVEARLRAMLL